MRWLLLISALLAALVIWTFTEAQGELSITLEPLDDYCEMSLDGSGQTKVSWSVSGGQEPYEVWIAGEFQKGGSGVAAVPCVGLRGRDIWINSKRSGPLSVVAMAEDSAGVRASNLAWVERLVEVLPLRWSGGGIYGGEQFTGPGWFRVGSLSFWVPEGEWEVQNHAESKYRDQRMLSLHGPGLLIRLDRETGQELERDPHLAEAEHAALNAQVDAIVASVGNTPSKSSMRFDGGVDTLTLELFAPAVCEASRWNFSFRRHPFEYRDHVVAEVEWRISGGQEPYTLYIAESEYEGAEGHLRIPCQTFANGVADSGLVSIAALVQDANGATSASIVQTYAVARTSAERYSEERLMNGGRTYRFEGIVMTIPEGLTLDISDGFGSEEVSCGVGSCTSASCANELNDNVCESSFSLWTRDHSVGARFGYTTKKMGGRGWIRDGWREDPGVNATSEAEIRELINQWADSVGKGPDLSSARWINPAPLQISGYVTNINCRVEWYEEELWANLRVVVSGGAWVPVGIELRDPSAGEPGSRGLLIGLARGRAEVAASLPCPPSYGWQAVTLNVHDVAPDDAWAETNIRFLNLPAQHRKGSLEIRASAWQSEREETAYCEPGSDVLLKWELRGLTSTEPFEVQINGQQQGSVQVRTWNDQTLAEGQARVPCINRPGLQVHTVYAVSGGSAREWVMIPVILDAVAEHPSGRSWSELRSAD